MRNRRKPKALSFIVAMIFFLSNFMGYGNVIPVRAATPATDLIISEYIEGSSNNKAIELFNGTAETIDLSHYAVKLYSNGSSAVGNTLNPTGTLESGKTYVIANSSAVAAIKDISNTTSTVTYFNGDDALTLEHDGVVIDSFGQVGFDPGTAWGTGSQTTVDHTLVRKSSVISGDADSSDAFDPLTEWDIYDKDIFIYLGSHTMDGFGGETLPDTTKPVIEHTPAAVIPSNQDLLFEAQITDETKVTTAKVYYRLEGATDYQSLAMTKVGTNNLYQASLQQSELTGSALEYYFEASDGVNTATLPVDINQPFKVGIQFIDQSGPQFLNQTPEEGSYTAETRPVIGCQWQDPSGAETSSLQVWLDEILLPNEKLAILATGDGFTYTPEADLADGKHTVKVSITDQASPANTTEESWDFNIGQEVDQYFFGNLHSHTNLSDGTGTPQDAYTWARDQAKVDFLAITDHSNSFDSDRDYTKSNEWTQLRQTADQFNENGKFTAIGAYEMTWSGSTGGWGHINTFNTDWFESRNNPAMDLKAYYDKIAQYPQSISQLNHPGSTFGDFADFGYYTPAADQVVNLIEVGNGEGQVRGSGYFPSYDLYTRALDKGWHLAPTNNQDNHLGKWGNANTARTVVIAPSLTRENLYAAMRERHVYATEDQNLKINYTVNGQKMGTILNQPESLQMHIDVADPDATDAIGKVSIIVDGGKVLENKTFSTNTAAWDLTLSPQYNYYYVRVDEADQDIAVTAPFWTGEVTPVGISKVEVSQNPQITGEPVEVKAVLYNNGVAPLSNVKVEFFKNSVTPENKIGEQTVAEIASSSSGEAKITWSTEQAGEYILYAQAVITYEGQEKSFTESTGLTIANEADVIKVVIDGGHENQYVSGDYAGKMVTLAAMLKAKKIMLVQNTDELTAADLDHAKLLIITDPQSKDDVTKNLTKSNFTPAELETINQYTQQGGSVLITSRADYDDKGVTDSSYQSSAQGNAILEEISSNLRLNDDEVIDNTVNGGQSYRLYFDDYTSSRYQLTSDIPSGEMYSAYSGCSVLLKNGGSEESIDWIVNGHDTTETMDSDLQQDATPVEKGKVHSLAAEILPNGSRLIVAGTTFFSDFETAAVDNAYSNALLTGRIVDWLLATKPIEQKTIAQVRVDANGDGIPDLLGQPFSVEGIVTAQSGAVGTNNAFFDVIYVQDATGGLTIFGVSNRVVPLGAKVRITGKVGQYEGDSQIQILNENTDLEILDPTPAPALPKTLSTGDCMLEANEGWLVQTEGTVSRLASGNGDNSLYLNDGSGEVRVYVNGYIGDGTDNSEMLGKWDPSIQVGDHVRVVGLASEDSVGHRIRVRNTAEIQKLTTPPLSGPLNYESITLDDAKKVTLTFNQVLQKADPSLDLKAAVRFASNGADFQELKPEDTVELKDKTLVVTFAQELSGNQNRIEIAAGTLKGESGSLQSEKVVTEPFNATIDECFIATASFGSKFKAPVVMLRHFRDDFLLTNPLGQAFVQFYYRHSPPIAQVIGGNEGLKILTRLLLTPFVLLVYALYHPSIFLLLIIALVGLKRSKVAEILERVKASVGNT